MALWERGHSTLATGEIDLLFSSLTTPDGHITK